jgi:hypothetical protein
VRHFAGQAMAAAAASERERVEWWRVGGGGAGPTGFFTSPPVVGGRRSLPWSVFHDSGAVAGLVGSAGSCNLRRGIFFFLWPVRRYGQLKNHAHDGDTSHRMFTIHNIMFTLTTRFSSLQSLMQRDSKVSSKNHSCLTRHVSHPTNKLYLSLR